MENATKALLIAGAVLLAIMIIGVGMLIFNSAGGIFNSATRKMSSQDIQAHNVQFENYQGKILGSQVKALMTDIATNNVAAVNEGDTAKLVDFELVGTNSVKVEARSDNTAHQSDLTNAKTKVINGKRYDITFEYEDDLVVKVTATEGGKNTPTT